MSIRSLFLCLTTLLPKCVSFPVHTIEDVAVYTMDQEEVEMNLYVNYIP